MRPFLCFVLVISAAGCLDDDVPRAAGISPIHPDKPPIDMPWRPEPRHDDIRADVDTCAALLAADVEATNGAAVVRTCGTVTVSYDPH